MVNIAVLISGGGSNLQSIIDEINNNNIKGKIKLVISNNKNAYGLERARKHGIDNIFVDPKKYSSASEYDSKIMEELKLRNIDIVVLAGYLKILSKEFVREYRNRIINIHPSLIPSFCGDGYYGEKVHRAVLDYGVKYTGATVHFVDEGTDTGPIIMQEIIKVEEKDTVKSLQKKVLEIEHEILPESLSLLCDNCIKIEDREVIIDRGEKIEESTN